jgi:hypothetical protein
LFNSQVELVDASVESVLEVDTSTVSEVDSLDELEDVDVKLEAVK